MAHNNSGILIVFDGIDGGGKTTQVGLLKTALIHAGLRVITSKEPTAGKWGKKIRESAKSGRMSPEEELHYFLMDREEHLTEIVTPALERGDVVILDRYYYSTICYQGARDADREFLRDTVMSRARLPDVSFIMDLNPHISQERIQTRDGVPNEFESLDYLVKVRENYEWLCEKDETLYEIDGNFPIQTIHETILGILIDGVFKDTYCEKSYGCDEELYCGFAMTGTCDWANLKKSLKAVGRTRYPALKYNLSRDR